MTCAASLLVARLLRFQLTVQLQFPGTARRGPRTNHHLETVVQLKAQLQIKVPLFMMTELRVIPIRGVG